MLAIKEYQTVTNISGPLMLVEMVDEAKYGHIVDIELADGSIRHGQILQVEKDKVLVQVFEGTSGIDVSRTTVRFLATHAADPKAKNREGQTASDIARKRGYAKIAEIMDAAIPGDAPGSGGTGFRTLYDDDKPSPPGTIMT